MLTHETGNAVKPSTGLLPYILLLRPQQWIKNFFLFIPLFFAGEIFKIDKLMHTLVGFVAFGFIASSIYILNDYMDVKDDRKHPVKSKRPIASGAVSKQNALVILFICLAIAICIGLYIKPKFLFILMIYFLINLGYSLGLKNISILDVILLSLGFVLRVRAGGVITMTGVSEWLIIMVFLIAIFMAVAKRRDDILIKTESGVDMRKSIKGYNLNFLNVILSMLAAIIIVAYLMYTISPEVKQTMGTYRVYYTCLFVIAGMLRYLQITLVENNTGSPTRLLFKDRFLQATILLWIISFYVIIYLPDFSAFQ